MYYIELKSLLKNVKIWVVSANGWYYSRPIAVFFNFDEAKQLWEEKTHLKWDIINSAVHLKKSYFKSNGLEGHWYYSIEEKTLSDLYAVYEKRIKESAFFEQRDEVIKNAEEHLKSDIRNECKEEFKKKVAQFLKEIEQTY